MPLDVSSADRVFRSSVESGELPAADFNHRAHLRLAYVYLAEHQSDANEAYERMRATLLHFLARHGVDPSKYHDTLTRAWILAVRHFMVRTPDACSADAFIDANPVLLDSKVMLTHYSTELLFSEQARRQFVEPDRDPIPRHERDR
ncbi:MAG TPA: hypothetical protein VLM41_07435 [Steroidobacteraceae bacterium]|nr:hypothetical protein [Steroidobacteraceae bacterium]